jgi:hypothetical protein
MMLASYQTVTRPVSSVTSGGLCLSVNVCSVAGHNGTEGESARARYTVALSHRTCLKTLVAKPAAANLESIIFPRCRRALAACVHYV